MEVAACLNGKQFSLPVSHWHLPPSPRARKFPAFRRAIQKKLAEINPLYQSNIRKYGPQTIELFTPLLAAGPKDGVSVTADQAYGADPQQTLDVYQPRGRRVFPVVVFVHGGARSRRETRTRTRRSTPMFSTILRATNSWASIPTAARPKVRLSNGSPDIRSVVAWIKKENAKALWRRSAAHLSDWAVDGRFARRDLGVRSETPRRCRTRSLGCRADQRAAQSRQSRRRSPMDSAWRNTLERTRVFTRCDRP